ncbi:MAG TPA: GNAT family N-acetyltransferase [candidate division Zixibacteria bacterium]|nr:GNAT family N-acetyltransferase [candidate division Zixibacteria bacterium]
MIELELDEFEKVRRLFAEVEYNLNCMVVIAGINPGRIWVDSKEKPTCGFLVDNVWAYFLAGDPNNNEFNKAIGRILKEELFSQAEKKEGINQGEWIMYFEDKDWFDKIESDFAIEDPMALKRYYYVFEKLLIPNWRTEIPKGFIMREIDASLLEEEKLENIEEMKWWMKTNYETTEKFLEKGLGFCLIEESTKTLASWCLSDWSVENKIEIGIITARNYRRKGFATLCTAAIVELCQEKGLQVGWHCNQENEGSWRTAEKVGFVRKKSYIVANGFYKEKDNLLYNAWNKGIISDKPEEGISYIKKSMEIEIDRRDYWVYAQLLIKQNKFNEAIDALMKIVELGPANPINHKITLETNEIFQELRKMKKWKEMMKSLDSLIKE